MKLKKRKKSSRLRGSKTAFYGARKKHRGSGHKGGKGMAGTGKRAGHKQSFVLKYLHPYFGKKGFTSKPTRKKKKNVINLEDIEKNLASFEKNKIAEKTKDGWIINLQNYKILSRGELKNKLIINALSASKNAIEKVEKASGKIILKKEQNKETEEPKVKEAREEKQKAEKTKKEAKEAKEENEF